MTLQIDDNWVDVSHSIGIPFGGIGTGYCVFGKYGFIRVNFDSTPDKQSFEYPAYGPQKVWDYLAEPEKGPSFGFILTEENREKCLVLQEKPFYWFWKMPGEPVDRIRSCAYLPKGAFVFEKPDWNLGLSMTAFSPMIPHDLENSTVPVQVYEITLENKSHNPRSFRLQLANRDPLTDCGNKGVYYDAHGQLAFGCDGGTVDENGVGRRFTLQPGETTAVRFFLAWYFPKFRTSSVTMYEVYQRYYTRAFPDALSVIDRAMSAADDWSAAIDQWHDSLQVPACFKRLWFSSLSSVMTSTMLSDDPYFFEIETPHRHVDTMDVNVYSSWLYMIHWPELERWEMDQYLKSIPKTGPQAGLVWHSLWNDAAHYVEEPIFLNRVYRDFLWFNDRQWLANAFDISVLAANRVYETGNHDGLIKSTHGNQSYDVWKMPGVSAFVNSAWIYGLYSLEKMATTLNKPAVVADMPVSELKKKAIASYDRILWNEKMQYWNCFFRTPDAIKLSVEDSAFTDQLFGKWAIAIDPGSAEVLPEKKVRRALETLYEHNLIDDPARGFRGWVNGMLPGRKPDIEHEGYHAWVCWICAQIDLGSLLGEAGNESASLDVFQSVERSLHNNHLAVGEYNQSVDKNLRSRTLPEEPGKDTPRFPPYPRYKCTWEYLIRLLGLKMDEQYLYLHPFRTIDFSIRDVRLAGMRLTVKVQSGWNSVKVNGIKVAGLIRLDRKQECYNLEFECNQTD